MIHFVIVMAVLAATHFFCFALISEFKYSVKKMVWIYTVSAIMFIGLLVLICLLLDKKGPAVLATGYLVTIILCFFVFIFTSTDPIYKKVFLYITYCNIFCILWGATDIFCMHLCTDMSQLQILYIKNMIRTVLTIPLAIFYMKCCRSMIRNIPVIEKQTWAALSLTSVLFLGVFSFLITKGYKLIFTEVNYFVLFATFCVIYASVLWLVFGNIQQMSRESKIKLINQKAKYLQNELEIARQNESITNQIKHDYRHHMLNIASMLQNGDVDHAIAYIDAYNAHLNVTVRKNICPNVIVNAILTSFAQTASNAGIDFSASADTPEASVIEDTDFVVILSNLLENAVNECKQCHFERKMRINIRTVEKKTVIVCSNSCREGIEIVGHSIKNKGVGIDSILTACRKYKGDINYKYENGILTACVILNA